MIKKGVNMIVLETLLGLVIVYLIFCICLVLSERFDVKKEKGFLRFCLEVGYTASFLGIAIGIILISHTIGKAII